jgi:hypothetical protein
MSVGVLIVEPARVPRLKATLGVLLSEFPTVSNSALAEQCDRSNVSAPPTAHVKGAKSKTDGSELTRRNQRASVFRRLTGVDIYEATEGC